MDRTEAIYVFDIDQPILQFLLTTLFGYDITVFCNKETFLASAALSRVGCVILNHSFHEGPSIEIQKELLWQKSNLSLISIAREHCLAPANQMIERGAVATLRWPFDAEEILSAVRKGTAKSEHRRLMRERAQDLQLRLNLLTENELSVLKYLIKGVSHKSISVQLDLSPRSVDRRCKSILEKLNAPNLLELIPALTGLPDFD